MTFFYNRDELTQLFSHLTFGEGNQQNLNKQKTIVGTQTWPKIEYLNYLLSEYLLILF